MSSEQETSEQHYDAYRHLLLALGSLDIWSIIDALVGASLDAEGPSFVEPIALGLLGHEDRAVREIAVISLAHLSVRARIPFLQPVLEALEIVEKDEDLTGRAVDLLDDVRSYGYVPEAPDPYASMTAQARSGTST